MGRLLGRTAELARVRAALEGDASIVVVAGEAGVGKTRLAREALVLAEDQLGASTAWVVASQAARRIPLGAFSVLLGGEVPPGSADQAQALRRVRDALRPDADRRFVVAVDDVDLLDELSLALLPLLAEAPDTSLVVTHRTERSPDTVVDLIRAHDPSTRIDLGPLDRAASSALVEQVLGAPLAAGSFERVWTASQGNPLFLGELARALRDGGALEEGVDGLRITGELGISKHLSELVAARIGDLDPGQRELLETLALHEPVGVDLVTEGVQRRDLEPVEEAGLVAVESSGRRRDLRLGHPVYGEVLRSELPSSRRERLSEMLADRLEETGLRRGDDTLTLALLRLETTREPDAGLLMSAAGHALAGFDHELAADLARRAVAAGGGDAARLLLGRALANAGRTQESEAAVAGIGWDAPEDITARAAIVRAHNLLFGSPDPRRAQEVLELALTRTSSQGWRDEIEAMLSLCYGVTGNFVGASESGRRMRERPEASDRATLSVLVVSTLADAMLGNLHLAETEAERALALAPRFREELPFAEVQLTINRLLVPWFRGQLDLAEQLGRQKLTDALEAREDDPAVLYGFYLASILVERGRAREALAVAGQTLDRGQGRSVFGIEPVVASMRARAAAALNEIELAEGIVAEVEPRMEGDVRARVHGRRATVWILAAQGRFQEAAQVAATEGAWAASTSHRVWAAFTLYDAVRCLHPELVLGDLRRLATTIEGELVPAMVRHAEALVGDDAAALDELAASFRDMGADAYAAEAASHAAAAHQRHGRAREARRSSALSHSCAATCQGEGFPLLVPVGHEPLTARELEIARVAAGGATSKEIADRLVLSTRTVDNHLASIYRKTGVAGRDELPEIFGMMPPGSE